tara:strand:+ start:582 stop:896 length:315 start_codon:yes stop_codon:yes gene_type:complete
MTTKKQKTPGSRNDAGVVALLYKVIECAVKDYKSLQEAGYIRKNRAFWPKNTARVCDYPNKQQVHELVCFFEHGHAKRYLENINSNIDPEAMLQSLGITKQKTP